jgi:signal transduction histidine kinase
MMARMRKPYPYLSDWLVISWRWLALFILSLTFAGKSGFNWVIIALLILIAVWNLAMTTLAILNVHMPAHRPVNLFCDFAFAAALFILGGAITGSLVWIGVVVLVNAAIYFQWRGAFLLAFLFSAFQIGYAIYLNPENLTAWVPFAIILGLNFLIAAIAGFGSTIVYNKTRQIQLRSEKQIQDIEARANHHYQIRMRSFSNLVETLSSTLDYTVVLDIMLDLSQTAIDNIAPNLEKMTSAVLLFDENKLIVVNARRLSPSDTNLKFPATSGILLETLQTVEPQIMLNPAKDPEIWKINALQNCRAVMILPLARGIDDYGVMLFGHPTADYFTEDKKEALQLISRQAVIAIQNARLYQQVEQEKQTIVSSQQEANKKLARDLHDGPIQSVASIAMRLSVAQRLLFHKPKDVAAELANIETLARQATGELRHMLFTLRPLTLETDGLAAGLQTIAEKNLNTYQQKVRIEVDEDVVKNLDENKHSTIFYLVEEAVTNARKHAQAELILVRLKYTSIDPEIAVLEIMDNGIGFDINTVNQKYSHRGSLGMVNLNERTQLINGLLHIDSVPERGSRVRVFIPLTTSAIERVQAGNIDLQRA